MSSLITLINGAFQDSFQNPVAFGYLTLVLTQSAPADGYTYEVLSPFTVSEVCAGLTFEIPLDANGDIIASPAYSVYANDQLMPNDSYYLVTCYDSRGQLVWGPNCQQVTSTQSPLSETFDVGQWTPNRIYEI